jgi:hypothetical protein
LRANLKELVRVQDAILFLRRVKSVIEVKADEWTLPLLTTGD